MPDMRLTFNSVDDKMNIYVDTDTGTVPLESVSQGTGSVVSWIGTLLERMYEVHASLENPESGGALVLIDEIDAHMHPKWQRLFVSAFREMFPSVQIVATSHSPLLVGSLTPAEIWVVQRVPLLAPFDAVVRLPPFSGPRKRISLESHEHPHKTYDLPAYVKLAVRNNEEVIEGEALTEDRFVAIATRSDQDLRGWRADQILTGPLFNLDTARDPETELMLESFTRLSALSSPSDVERAELEELSSKLKVRLPTPLEREEARRAYDIIHDSAMERLKELSPEERHRVLDEVKVQMIESITGSRRPS